MKATNKQEKQTNKNAQSQQQDGGYHRERERWGVEGGAPRGGEKEVKRVEMEDLTLAGGYTMQWTDDVSLNCTHETYIILLTNVTTEI